MACLVVSKNQVLKYLKVALIRLSSGSISDRPWPILYMTLTYLPFTGTSFPMKMGP